MCRQQVEDGGTFACDIEPGRARKAPIPMDREGQDARLVGQHCHLLEREEIEDGGMSAVAKAEWRGLDTKAHGNPADLANEREPAV
jgi:hypothetical protein